MGAQVVMTDQAEVLGLLRTNAELNQVVLEAAVGKRREEEQLISNS